MKKLTLLVLGGAFCLATILPSYAVIDPKVVDPDCGYKKKGCWFSSKVKCSGDGTDCSHASPCS